MKFIHAVIFDVDEFKDITDTSWENLTDGDYIVHCLYSIDSQKIIMLNDNTHTNIEENIDSFLEGIEYCLSMSINDANTDFEPVDITKAYIVVDNSLSYNEEAVGLCLNEENYVEVE